MSLMWNGDVTALSRHPYYKRRLRFFGVTIGHMGFGLLVGRSTPAEPPKLDPPPIDYQPEMLSEEPPQLQRTDADRIAALRKFIEDARSLTRDHMERGEVVAYDALDMLRALEAALDDDDFTPDEEAATARWNNARRGVPIAVLHPSSRCAIETNVDDVDARERQ